MKINSKNYTFKHSAFVDNTYGPPNLKKYV